MGEKWSAARRMLLSAATTAFAMWLLLYAPSPYVVYEPGIAVPVKPMVQLTNAAGSGSRQGTSSASETIDAEAGVGGNESGMFILTAVRLTDPNIWGVIAAGVDPDKDVRWKHDVFGGKSKSQYVERLNEIMSGSQESALQAAYNYTGVSFRVEQGKTVPERTKNAVHIQANEIGGPSAGLVFALQTIDLLTGGDLAEGLRIAATGTIDEDGNIGAIGGVKQKTVSVSGDGADLFLVPKGNEKQARQTAERLSSDTVVVGVATLDEAVRAIAALAAERRG